MKILLVVEKQLREHVGDGTRIRGRRQIVRLFPPRKNVISDGISSLSTFDIMEIKSLLSSSSIGLDFVKISLFISAFTTLFSNL